MQVSSEEFCYCLSGKRRVLWRLGFGKGPRWANPGLTFHPLIPGGPQLHAGAARELRGGGRGVPGACPREATAFAPARLARSCGPGRSWRAGPGAGREQNGLSRCGRRGGSRASWEACGTQTGERSVAGSCGAPGRGERGRAQIEVGGAGTVAWRSASRPGPKPLSPLDPDRAEPAQPAASGARSPVLGPFSLPVS